VKIAVNSGRQMRVCLVPSNNEVKTRKTLVRRPSHLAHEGWDHYLPTISVHANTIAITANVCPRTIVKLSGCRTVTTLADSHKELS
jgi:hypothetical protein